MWKHVRVIMLIPIIIIFSVNFKDLGAFRFKTNNWKIYVNMKEFSHIDYNVNSYIF